MASFCCWYVYQSILAPHVTALDVSYSVTHCGDSGKSLREIGREIAAEIERIFEAKVKPTTLISKVQRVASDANASQTATAEHDSGNGGDNGDGWPLWKSCARWKSASSAARPFVRLRNAQETRKPHFTEVYRRLHV